MQDAHIALDDDEDSIADVTFVENIFTLGTALVLNMLSKVLAISSFKLDFMIDRNILDILN